MLWGLSFTNTWVLLTIIRDMITCFGVFSHTSTMPFHLHPCCTWKKIRGFQVVHNRYLHQSDPTISKFILHGFLPKQHPWRISQTMNQKIWYNPHGSDPFSATNFHLMTREFSNENWSRPKFGDTIHAPKKTQLSTVYPRPSSQRWHSRCPFPPSLPVVLHARALWELSGKDCSVISHNCLFFAFPRKSQVWKDLCVI